MGIKEFCVCDSCDAVIANPDQGVVVIGNITTANPDGCGGVIGNGKWLEPQGDLPSLISLDNVPKTTFCHKCFLEALPWQTSNLR